MKAGSSDQRKEYILRAPEMDIDSDAYKTVEKRTWDVKASSQDHWTVIRAQYCQERGLARVDAAFLDEHGTHIQPASLILLAHAMGVDKRS